MKRRPKDIGTASETAVVRYLQANGWPNAERRALKGGNDEGDITGTPGICWEVKGGEAAKSASDNQVADWLIETETERRHADADIGVLVIQRRGVGAPNAGRWWAVMRLEDAVSLRTGTPRYAVSIATVRMLLADAVRLLRTANYGDPIPAEEVTTP